MNDFQEQLRQPYSRDLWSGLLPRLLPGRLEWFRQPVAFLLTAASQLAIATGFRQCGRAVIPDGQGGERILAVFEVDVAAKVDLLRNRVALRQLVARCIDEVSAHAVLAVFARPGSRDPYRLTYASRESVLNADTLAVESRETATRRFTFVLGPGETRRTAAKRLAGLADRREQATLREVTDAFSVDLLNKEFFDTYKAHYQKFCAHLLAGDAPARVFGIKLKGLDDKARDHALKPVRDFVKKMLGRLVFLHFLQQKGWLGCPATATHWKNGDPAFIHRLFDSAPADEQRQFHSRRLVPLFFDTLNRQRKGDLFAITGTRVPYLNGGLFERDFNGVEALDFPAAMFRDLLDFFGQYNFTIDENDPDDHEIGIDPEMLGHIFENLLEDNKDKGAYYTPKAIVQYMCRQSLIHALAGRFPEDPAARGEIEKLIRHKEPINPQQDSWLATHATALEKILDDLNLCDPAIGSGAFPIGLLQEIYWTKLTLHPALDRAAAKRAIIQHSIHGVDLDAGAVEIARLRFWLALVVEEKKPVPLPNLDYQIMQGNSLLESFEGLDLSKISEPKRVGVTLLGNDQVEFGFGSQQVELTVPSEPQETLEALQQKYFACHDAEQKARLRAQIDAAILRAIDYELELRREVLAATLDNWRRELARKRKLTKNYEPTAKELKTRDTMQAELDALAAKKTKLHALLENPRAERPFFLWNLWFRHILGKPPHGHGGFDIVIANPPYVRQEVIKHLKPALKAERYECYNGIADLYIYFYELSFRCLRAGGTLCFISSNSVLNSDFGLLLRHKLLNDASLTHILDFAEAPVFNAVTEPVIIGLSKSKPTESQTVSVLKWNEDWLIDRVQERIAASGSKMKQSELTAEVWRLESPAVLTLLEKVRSGNQPLGKIVGDHFYRGILTGFNQAFIIDRAQRDKLIAEHASSRSLIQPFLRGKDVKKWKHVFSENYLIRIESSSNKTHSWSNQPPADAEKIFAREYPAVFRWLNGFRGKLLSREDQGAYFWELRSCAYWAEFSEPKIIYQEINRTDVFAYDDQGILANNKVFILPGASKATLALLNSRFGIWFIHAFSGVPMGGFLALQTPIMSAFPIASMTAAEQATLTALVDRIIAAKEPGDDSEVVALETEIDEHVFRLYALTPEEIELVKGTTK